ncbi:MAG TPA: efflux RND transporter periplasmic adaptor subunit [Usitatibacter sp.]|nr:efflux RND transporter periplasmic adaptor subunit [Usitatibacter sp.]
MKHPLPALRWPVFSFFAAALLGACSGEKQVQATPPPPEVKVVSLEARTISLTRELPGRISPFVVAEVRPQVGGIVKSVNFTEGGLVKAGQPLYVLDDDTLRADAGAARAQVAKAEATAAAARLTAQRTSELARIEAVSKQEAENAIAAQRQAEADVAATKAALARAQVLLAHARIESPITGRIGKSTVTRGALVTANQPQALATVQQLDPIYLDLTQSSSELLALRRQLASGKAREADLPVKVFLEDGTAYEHAGKLKFADATVDPATGSYLLRVVVPNPRNVLLPGMFVRAELGSAVRENALLVPQPAVARDPKGNTSVMLLDAQNKVVARPVRVSSAHGDAWLVEEGLAAGDRVIVEGLQKVKPGVVARVANEAPARAAAAPASAAAPK